MTTLIKTRFYRNGFKKWFGINRNISTMYEANGLHAPYISIVLFKYFYISFTLGAYREFSVEDFMEWADKGYF